MNGGAACPPLQESMRCNIEMCPSNPFPLWDKADRRFAAAPCALWLVSLCFFCCSVDCKTTEWKNWGSCSVTCGRGQRRRQKKILRNPLYGGAACGNLGETEACSSDPCEGNLFKISFPWLSNIFSWLWAWGMVRVDRVHSDLRRWNQEEREESCWRSSKSEGQRWLWEWEGCGCL